MIKIFTFIGWVGNTFDMDSIIDYYIYLSSHENGSIRRSNNTIALDGDTI